MARPNKEKSITIVMRNRDIVRYHKQGYSLTILSEYFNLDKSVISRIINKAIKLATAKKG